MGSRGVPAYFLGTLEEASGQYIVFDKDSRTTRTVNNIRITRNIGGGENGEAEMLDNIRELKI